jgi:hypothetical protein
MRSLIATVAYSVLAAATAPTVDAQEVQITLDNVAHGERDYSPFIDQHFPTRVFWGDTHLHTANSPDAGLMGTNLGPEAAYRFARGEEVTSNTGQRAKLIKPLDFLVVADHAEFYGVAPAIKRGDEAILADPKGREWYDAFKSSAEEAHFAALDLVVNYIIAGRTWPPAAGLVRSTWERNLDTADAYNAPGIFTALIGFEWSTAPGGDNLHRVVVFRDDGDRAGRVLPFGAHDSEDPEDLWSYMAGYEASTGGQMLAIPHNGNWSNGAMFAVERRNGQPFNRAYVEGRARWEPLYEVTQIKGDGETHPFLSPDDEFADFETWDRSNVNARVPKTNDMLQHEYARSALRTGLSLEEELGTNPFKFGMIGSTDSHTALPSFREDNWWGKMISSEPSPTRGEHYLNRLPDPDNVALAVQGYEYGASGLAGVWARENTRESLFDAMMRKEVYATSGSRILVRVFAGWDFEADEVERPDFAERGYVGGVPMGGDLTDAPAGEAPKFMIRALRDPDNANLDRVQIIKGWLDASGENHERIYDVACSDDRAIRDRRCEREVGSTVDIADASYTNTIGDPLLTAYWEDPDFDADQSAFYYVRVIEIPKPRWTAYDAKYFGIEMPEDVAMTVKDRAYTSPIWYTP